MDYGIFNVHADVNECDCTQGCTDTVRESALKVDSGRKIPAAPGNGTYFSKVPVLSKYLPFAGPSASTVKAEIHERFRPYG